MIQKMFSVRDSKAQAFLQPFFSSASGSALRALGDAVADGKSPLSLHPEDYILYEVGGYDDQTGEVFPLNPIKLLAMAVDFCEKPKAVLNHVFADMTATDSDLTRELNGKK